MGKGEGGGKALARQFAEVRPPLQLRLGLRETMRSFHNPIRSENWEGNRNDVKYLVEDSADMLMELATRGGGSEMELDWRFEVGDWDMYGG